jgi:2,3-bisphosphoglycerate-dependent phosphoglycerate mutase
LQTTHFLGKIKSINPINLYYNDFVAKLFIFRHGQTKDNLKHTFSGFRQSDLTENGIEEAKQIAEKLKSEKVTKAYQSDLIRSQHTLEFVLNGYHHGVEIKTDPRIKERDYGDLTGLNKDDIEKQNPQQYKLWHRSYDVPPPNGESIQMVEVRVLSFLNEILPTLKSDDIVFISASANSIRPMRKYFEHLSNKEICSYEYTPAQIFEYQI